MSGTLAVLRRELGAALGSPTAWVLTVLFVVALHGAFFLLGFPFGDYAVEGFWAARVASLDVLFAWLPLVFCVLAPALTMGAWAEERRSGTDELLLTHPRSTRAIVLGKFLAVWILLGLVTTVAVVPVAVVVGTLGPLDWATAGCGLVSAWMLAAAFCALGLTASALANDELTAFVISAILLLTLWSGTLFVRALPVPLAEAAWYASPALHFLETGARGVLDARDVVYHGLFSLCGLVLNVAVVEGRRYG